MSEETGPTVKSPGSTITLEFAGRASPYQIGQAIPSPVRDDHGETCFDGLAAVHTIETSNRFGIANEDKTKVTLVIYRRIE